MFRKNSSPQVHPLSLIVGLGNPGPQYRGTRHNVGFEVVEALAKKHKIDLSVMKHKAQYGSGQVAESATCLIKPLTYMNLSGEAIKPIANHYNIAPAQILVIADDLDLPCGKVRMRLEGSPGGHNGHKSVVKSLQTQEYPRIKIGIGRGEDPTIDHVLSRFKPDERTQINEAVEKAVKAVEAWLASGPDRAMQIANG